MSKIALLYPDDYSFWLFRQGLLKKLVSLGHEVVIICRDTGYAQSLSSLGVRHIEAPFERFMSIRSDIKLFLSLIKIFKTEKPDIVHNFTMKPNAYGSIAAWVAGIQTVLNSVTGLGFIGDGILFPGFRPSFKQRVGTFLYKIAGKICTRTWFQNPDDMNFFITNSLIERDRCVLIKSSGIDQTAWSRELLNQNKLSDLRESLNVKADAVVVTMVSRILRSKGVLEFIDAAKIVKKSFPNTKFLLIGKREDRGDDSVSTEVIESSGGPVEWLGEKSDIINLLGVSHIAVLPSYYPEGVPRSLLEAMCLSLPIVTTDTPGCRETVQNGLNGYLVPAKDSASLSEAIKELVSNGLLREIMGKVSRDKVISEFAEESVISRLISELYMF